MRSHLHHAACTGSMKSAYGQMPLIGWTCNLISLYIPSSLSGLKGSFSLSLTFTSRLAPDPSLVIYAIFPSGGVVADKIQFSVEMCFDNQVKWQRRRVKTKVGHRERSCVCWGWRQDRSGKEDNVDIGCCIIFMSLMFGVCVEIHLSPTFSLKK